MPNLDRLLNTLHRAADAFRRTPGRRGRLVPLQGCTELIVAGDLHGNVENLRRLLLVADLAKEPTRHLAVQELIHGPFRYAQGGDRSHQMLDLVAALKCQFPLQVHMLLGNHELAQWTGECIFKGNDELLALFDQGVADAYAPRDAEVLAAYDELFAVAPLVLRTANGVCVCHSLPSSQRRDRFDPAQLEQEMPEKEYRPGGGMHALLWGRDTSEENVQSFLGKIGASWLISGHIPCERGFDTPNSRQLILDAEGSPACCCRFRTDGAIALEELIAGVVEL